MIINNNEMAPQDVEPEKINESSNINTSVMNIVDETGAFMPDWHSKFESLQDSASVLAQFRSPEELAKGYSELDKQRCYPQLDDQDAMNAFRSMVGLPDNMEDFQLKRPDDIDEGVWSDTLAKDIAQAAYQYGVPAEAMNALQDVWVKSYKEANERWEQERQSGLDEAEKELKNAWGHDYETNIQKATHSLSVLSKRAGVDAESIINDPTISSNPEIVKIMYEVSHLLGEAPLHQNDNIQLSGQDEARRMENDASHPLHEAYMKYNHPNHHYANQVYDRLMNMNR